MAEHDHRQISNARMRHVLLAVQDIMGRNGLMAVLRSAELERFVAHLPPDNQATDVLAAELGRLVGAIETQYGRGARGQLTRIGYSAFQHILNADRVGWGTLRLLLRALPVPDRRRRALSKLARYLSTREGEVSVSAQEEYVLFEDGASDETRGRCEAQDNSYLTIGLLQACLEWATGEAADVMQVSHKARGDPAALFEIRTPSR